MRIYQIDALRGFALFGILVVNIFVFHAPYPHYGAFYFEFQGFERTVVQNVIFFFAGKFMFIYAFLFGYGFWMQYQNQKENFSKYWNKRMLLLSCFGVLHVLLLSYGDILLPYAILGLSLPFFARLKNTTIVIWLIVISLIPVYEFVLRGFVTFPSIFMSPTETLENYIAINGQGSFLDIFKLRMKDYFSFKNEKLIMYIPKEMTLFLVGMLAGRIHLATKVKVSSATIVCIVSIILVGLMHFFRPNVIAFFDFQNSVFQRIILGLIIHTAEFLHGLIYIIGFFLLWQISFVEKILYILTYAGRLSLTNYITQSLVCVIIFSGLGYYGQLTPSSLVKLAIAIYSVQLLFSYFWLKNFKYGPLEAVWRKFSKA